jgi:hypothetical protein
MERSIQMAAYLSRSTRFTALALKEPVIHGDRESRSEKSVAEPLRPSLIRALDAVLLHRSSAIYLYSTTHRELIGALVTANIVNVTGLSNVCCDDIACSWTR